MKILIIIPTYNERDNLENLIGEVFRYLPTTNILVIDDNSPDGTGKIADSLSRTNPQVKVIHRSCKMGLGSAYLLGFRHALMNNYDYVITMDCDFSHDPKYLPQFLKEAQSFDLILGSRYIKGGDTKGWGVFRRFVSKAGNSYARFILRIKIRDLTAGFRCFSRKVLQTLLLNSIRSKGYAFLIETTYRVYKKGFSIKEIPIVFLDRKMGRSKLDSETIFEAAIKVLMLPLSKNKSISINETL